VQFLCLERNNLIMVIRGGRVSPARCLARFHMEAPSLRELSRSRRIWCHSPHPPFHIREICGSTSIIIPSSARGRARAGQRGRTTSLSQDGDAERRRLVHGKSAGMRIDRARDHEEERLGMVDRLLIV
jgi:hypothetical protein